jgi:hypothetical protein
MMKKVKLLATVVTSAWLLAACGPSISSLTVTCAGSEGTVRWEASGDPINLNAAAPVQGTGKVEPKGELKYTADAPVIFWLDAGSGKDKVTTGAVCR